MEIYEKIKYTQGIKAETYQLLGWLGYEKVEEFHVNRGKWEIYVKKDYVFPYFVSTYSFPINKFIAIYKEEKFQTVVRGNFENIEKLKKNLQTISETFFIKERKFLFIPITLTEENAQDYGYIRGLLLGLFLLFADIIYSWIFKLKYGVLTGFIDYIKRVYDGNPTLGIEIGILGTGLYLGFLLIFLPIVFGNYYVKKEKKLREKKYINLPAEIKEYEFGIEAEKSLQDEFEIIVEEKRKEKIYQEISRFGNINKEDFEALYNRVNQGFLTPESLSEFIEEYEKKMQNLPLGKFLEILLKYKKAPIKNEIKISD